MLVILCFFIGHWFLSLFCQTFFLHRYSSHKMFTMNKFWERFFHALTWVAQGSSYLNPRAYAIMHRMHHAFSDTEKDPHSPHFYDNAFSMMKQTFRMYNDLIHRKYEASKEFVGNYPKWEFIDKYGNNIWTAISWGVIYTIIYFFFAAEWWLYFLLPVHYMMGPIHGAIVNWCGHKYGYSNFDNNDKSKNTFFWDLFLLGELFQNNHHKYPNSPNFAKKWFEFDPLYPVIKLLSWMRIIKMAKVSVS